MLRAKCKDGSGSVFNMLITLPNVTPRTDLYQIGLIMLEMVHERSWHRGDIL